MIFEEVQQLILIQANDHLACVNDHRMSLKQALVSLTKISITVHTVEKGKLRAHKHDVWLVGQENSNDGYRIVMREDGQFGLASPGFPSDNTLVLVGWYGTLRSAFMSM